jgi:hypothetical protein
MLEGWSWNQIVVPSVFSVIVFFVTKWKYKKHALFHARSGGGKLIE